MTTCQLINRDELVTRSYGRSTATTIIVQRVLTVLIVLVASAAPNAADPIVDDVRRAHADVDAELGHDAVSNTWRQYLQLDELKNQLDRGDQIDVKAIESIRDRFAREDQNGVLRRPPYRAALGAIEAWLARLKAVPADELPELARQAAAEATLPSTPSADEIVARLRGAAANIDQHLRSISSQKTADGWRKYFLYQELIEQTADAQSCDPVALDKIAARYEGAAPLFDGKKINETIIRTTGEQIRQAARQLRLVQTTDEQFKEHLTLLADALAEHVKQPTGATAEAVAGQLGWLRERGLAGPLLAAVDGQFRRPNIFLHVSRPLAAAGIEVQHDYKDDVNTAVMGTSFEGKSRTHGQIRLQLVPDFDRARANFLLQTQVDSNTVGYNSGVTVRSTGTINIHGMKPLTLDAAGFHWQPATADVHLKTNINDAWGAGGDTYDYVYSNQPATDRAFERGAKARVQRELNQQAEDSFTTANSYVLRKLRMPLKRQDAFPADVRLYTTGGAIRLTAIQAGGAQLAAPSDPPEMTDRGDLSIVIHESMINNLAVALLGGHTLDEPDLEPLLDEYLGFVPEGLKTADLEHPWAVTFESQQPLVVKVDDDQLVLTLHADGFQVGDKKYPAMRITARYRLGEKAEDEPLVALRQGRLDILPKDYQPGSGQRLGARYSTLRTLLRKRFDHVLPERIQLDRFHLPRYWYYAGTMNVVGAVAENGWLALEYRPVKDEPIRRAGFEEPAGESDQQQKPADDSQGTAKADGNDTANPDAKSAPTSQTGDGGTAQSTNAAAEPATPEQSKSTEVQRSDASSNSSQQRRIRRRGPR